MYGVSYDLKLSARHLHVQGCHSWKKGGYMPVQKMLKLVIFIFTHKKSKGKVMEFENRITFLPLDPTSPWVIAIITVCLSVHIHLSINAISHRWLENGGM